MMQSNLFLRRVLTSTTTPLRRSLSSAASDASAATGMTLNFNLPSETVYSGAKVDQVIVPGAAGEYGITADHVPVVAQLKPGVMQILHEGTSEPEKYFVPGGFSITHSDSVTDISCPEAVKVDDIDSAAVSSAFEAAKSAFAAAEAGSVEQAYAQIDMEVNKAMGAAVGVTLS